MRTNIYNACEMKESPLGKITKYYDKYDSKLLFPIARIEQRSEINIPAKVPFVGFDIWNAYELSWLNNFGKPQNAIAQFIIPADSPYLIESKSLKLYLNSFNATTFTNANKVTATIIDDISCTVGKKIEANLWLLNDYPHTSLTILNGTCLDDLEVECDKYEIYTDYLTSENTIVSETVYSDLFKSNCPITNQPDLGNIHISYSGNKINHHNLLKYLVSFRNHNGFHEQCVEKIYTDILARCAPQKLAVCGRYTRRGGIDINPCRASDYNMLNKKNIRLCRQ